MHHVYDIRVNVISAGIYADLDSMYTTYGEYKAIPPVRFLISNSSHFLLR